MTGQVGICSNSLVADSRRRPEAFAAKPAHEA
jgi:hypothetical protein